MALMVSDFDRTVAVASLLDHRYTVRYPFSVTAEILELETGIRLRGVTSDLSRRGCFVRTASLLAASGPCAAPPDASEEETESSDPRGDPEGCADWNGPGVPRYRPAVKCNSTVVD